MVGGLSIKYGRFDEWEFLHQVNFPWWCNIFQHIQNERKRNTHHLTMAFAQNTQEANFISAFCTRTCFQKQQTNLSAASFQSLTQIFPSFWNAKCSCHQWWARGWHWWWNHLFLSCRFTCFGAVQRWDQQHFAFFLYQILTTSFIDALFSIFTDNSHTWARLRNAKRTRWLLRFDVQWFWTQRASSTETKTILPSFLQIRTLWNCTVLKSGLSGIQNTHLRVSFFPLSHWGTACLLLQLNFWQSIVLVVCIVQCCQISGLSLTTSSLRNIVVFNHWEWRSVHLTWCSVRGANCKCKLALHNQLVWSKEFNIEEYRVPKQSFFAFTKTLCAPACQWGNWAENVYLYLSNGTNGLKLLQKAAQCCPPIM